MDKTEKISEILHDIVECDVITPESDLQDDLGMDSLELVTLLIRLEETFQIEMDESDMNPFEMRTVSDIVEVVSKYCGVYDKKAD